MPSLRAAKTRVAQLTVALDCDNACNVCNLRLLQVGSRAAPAVARILLRSFHARISRCDLPNVASEIGGNDITILKAALVPSFTVGKV